YEPSLIPITGTRPPEPARRAQFSPDMDVVDGDELRGSGDRARAAARRGDAAQRVAPADGPARSLRDDSLYAVFPVCRSLHRSHAQIADPARLRSADRTVPVCDSARP